MILKLKTVDVFPLAGLIVPLIVVPGFDKLGTP